MDKRTFLRTTTAIAAGTVLSRFTGCMPSEKPLKNWAGNLEYGTSKVFYPKSVDELCEIVKKNQRLRALGSMHSFNKIADSSEVLVSLREMKKVVALDTAKKTITVEAGIKYGEVCQYLDENGFALHNLASLPHISIAGSITTATHGSGLGNGNLSTSVIGIEFVNAAGEIVNLTKADGETFNGAVVGLGALGIITKLTLQLVPTFKMHQLVYRNLPMAELEKNVLAIAGSGYSVSLFTDWKNKNINEVWIKSKSEESATEFAQEFYGAKLADRNMHPIETESADNCTDQMGVPGPWYERLPHFKMGFKPSAGKELQSEYFVSIDQAYDAIMAVEKIGAEISPHLFISEIRMIAADELWMSPCYRKACIAIHTTWKQEDAVYELLPKMEAALAPFNPRPHWAKLFALDPGILQSRIERLNDFKALAAKYDPEGKFRNSFLEMNLYGKTV